MESQAIRLARIVTPEPTTTRMEEPSNPIARLARQGPLQIPAQGPEPPPAPHAQGVNIQQPPMFHLARIVTQEHTTTRMKEPNNPIARLARQDPSPIPAQGREPPHAPHASGANIPQPQLA